MVQGCSTYVMAIRPGKSQNPKVCGGFIQHIIDIKIDDFHRSKYVSTIVTGRYADMITYVGMGIYLGLNINYVDHHLYICFHGDSYPLYMFWDVSSYPRGGSLALERTGVPADELLLCMQVSTFVQKQSDHLHGKVTH